MPRSLSIDALGGRLNLTEKLPARAIPGKMIEARVSRDSLQPPAGGRTRTNHIEPLKGAQEDGLRDVLRFGRVPEQPDGRRIHHVLVLAHERLKLVGVDHPWDVVPRRSLGEEHRSLRKCFTSGRKK